MTDITAIRERLSKITPGEWRLDPHYGCFVWGPRGEMIASESDEGEMLLRGVGGNLPMIDNADFIAHAPDDIRSLLSDLEAADAEIKRLKEGASLADHRGYYAERLLMEFLCETWRLVRISKLNSRSGLADIALNAKGHFEEYRVPVDEIWKGDPVGEPESRDQEIAAARKQAFEEAAEVVDRMTRDAAAICYGNISTISAQSVYSGILALSESGAGKETKPDLYEGHQYTSTACHHGLHDRCRKECKFCGKPCTPIDLQPHSPEVIALVKAARERDTNNHDNYCPMLSGGHCSCGILELHKALEAFKKDIP